jgi:hypothetical protein
MDLKPVKSSNLTAVGYDPATKILEIKFTDGTIHQYAGVPPKEHAKLMSAKSVGYYFFEKIRDHYSSTAMDKPRA